MLMQCQAGADPKDSQNWVDIILCLLFQRLHSLWPLDTKLFVWFDFQTIMSIIITMILISAVGIFLCGENRTVQI